MKILWLQALVMIASLACAIAALVIIKRKVRRKHGDS